MSQTMSPDREVGGGPGTDDRPMTTLNQPSQGESNFWDTSGQLFSIYSKAAEEEDNKMVERWQKDADGILIFTGLFSAAVAALLAVTVLDLRPNSQDISAFYLGNIFQVLADPNVTQISTPPPVSKPPSFSPARYAVWVNTLWFLSLVMSLSCALWATLLQQWARRYIHRAQPSRCRPEKRARMRAFFAEGVDKMHIPWAVEGLPMLLHLSLFLFFGGVAIFLFNVNQEVFVYVIWWICLFCLVYLLITLLPTIRHDSPYHSPLSTPAWLLYSGVHHMTFKILAFITLRLCWSYETWENCGESSYRSRRWMLGGVDQAAKETASERSSEIDVRILEWTLSALGDDDSLKNFFEAIPCSFNSKMLEHLRTDLPSSLRRKILLALEGFCDRTLSSDSVSDSEKVRRIDISYNAINQIGETPSLIYFLSRRKDVPQTIEMGHTVARWFTNNGRDIPELARGIIARVLVEVRERNDSWVTLAAPTFGLSKHDLRKNIALGGDSVLLAILIHVTRRQCLRSDYLNWTALRTLSKLDTHSTHPRVQKDFCESWNEIVQEARNRGPYSDPVDVLRFIRLPYIALHQGTDAAPTAFSASTDYLDTILCQSSSYPFCNLTSHHADSTDHVSLPLPIQPSNLPYVLSSSPTDCAEQASNFVAPHPFTPTATSEIGTTSHGHDIANIILTNPFDYSSRPTGVPPMTAVVTAPQVIAPTAILSRLGGSGNQDLALNVSGAESETDEILSTSSTNTSTPTPTPISTSPLDALSESYDAGGASISADPSHFAPPPIGSFITASHPTGSVTFPCLRARGLVNTMNICFVNATLQLLVNSPPFWNLFRKLADLKEQRRIAVPETGGSTTPLVDTTVRFFKEYMVKDQSQPETGRVSRPDEEKKNKSVVDSFEPIYMYDAMKEKNQLGSLLDGQQQDAEQFFSLYLDALDEELPALLPPIGVHQSTRATLGVEEREVPQSGQAEVGTQGSVTGFFKSPITHIFGGRFRLPVRASNMNQSDPVPTEDWQSLHLDIQPDSVLTIEDALLRINQSRSMQDNPSGLTDGSQQILIEALPPVLVLHLKRFQNGAAAGGVIKIDKPVRFSPELENPSDIMVLNFQRPSKAPRYKLYGVLYHHGESADTGHYTVDVLHPNGDGETGEAWLRIDDEAVTRIGYEDIFGEHGEWVADERCAYLLFYCRIEDVFS